MMSYCNSEQLLYLFSVLGFQGQLNGTKKQQQQIHMRHTCLYICTQYTHMNVYSNICTCVEKNYYIWRKITWIIYYTTELRSYVKSSYVLLVICSPTVNFFSYSTKRSRTEKILSSFLVEKYQTSCDKSKHLAMHKPFKSNLYLVELLPQGWR